MNNKIEEYINNYNNLKKNIVYDFKLGFGGIGDYIKFYIFLLNICIDNNYKLYYKINNIFIEKYIKIKFKEMLIIDDETKKKKNINSYEELFEINNKDDKNNEYYIVTPNILYKNFSYYNLKINVEDIFEFSEEIKLNRNKLLPNKTLNYISLHLRLGDKHLEEDKKNIICKNDERYFNEEKIINYINNNNNKNIIFICDNNAYKLKMKEKFNNIIIIDCEIGHTSHNDTTEKQVIDTITEFYIMTCSEKIIMGSYSGFSIMASKFKNIELIKLYEIN